MELDREFRTMEIQRSYMTDEKGEPNDFTFFLESIGVQRIPDIVKSGIAACEALVDKYKDLDAVIPPTVRVQQGDSRFPTMDIIFQHESHTLGNLMETYLVENHIDGTQEPKITYAGYKVPHPLKPEMFVRIGASGLDADIQKQSARLVLAMGCRTLKDQFRQLQGAWNAVSATATSTAV